MQHKGKIVDVATLREITDQVMREDPEHAQRVQEGLRRSQPIVKDLADLGYNVQTLAELRHLGKEWKTALPTLLRWLPLMHDEDIKEEIVRSLSVPWIGKEATAQLIEEFRNAPLDSSLAWAIGNALSIVNVRGFEKEILALCREPKYRTARQMLVFALNRLHSAEAEQTALDLLADEDVKLHAISALKKMKSKRALVELERLLTDKRSVIRREARKAIARIMNE